MFKYIFFVISVLFLQSYAHAQTSIKGIVLTNDQEPATQVNITLNELKLQTVSNEDGVFVFENVPTGVYNISISYIGVSVKKSVEVINGTPTSIKITLPQNAQQLDAVVVNSKKGMNTTPLSAGKVAINPLALPQSVAVVGQMIMKDQQAQRLSDVIRNVNGVYLGTTRGNVQESFSARGYGFSSSNMFKNGARVNTGIMPEISSLEKVEILKGSAAILYGNVAPGGIINMVTKQPKFNFGGEVALRTGSYGLVKPSVDVYGPINKNIAYRINTTVEKADSYRDQVQSDRFYVNPSFLFNLSKKSSLLIQGDYLKANFTPDFGIGTIDNTIIPNVKRSAFFGTPWQYNKVQQATATATYKYQINSNWSLATNTSYQQFTRNYYSIERIQALANGDFTRPLNRIQLQEDYAIVGVDVTGKFKTGNVQHTLLTGMDADHYFTTNYTFNNPTTYDKINILDPNKFTPRTDIPAASKVTRVQTPIYRMGAYVQDLITLSPKFNVLAGIRWSQQQSKAATTKYILKDSIAKSIAKVDQAFSPRLGLVYRPTQTTSLFASYANSFNVNSGTDVFGNALAPSIVDQYEVGIKNELLQGRLSFNVTAYKIINNNLAQTAQFAADGVTPNNNSNLRELTGQTTSDGVEVDVQATPVKGLHIIAGYSYNNMRYTKVKEGKGNYIKGERLINTPANTANASITYAFHQQKLNGLKVGVSTLYIGDRLGGWNNTQQQTQNYNRLINVKGFTTVDVMVGYVYKRFSLQTKLSNIFNVYNYYVHENYSVNPIAPTQFVSTLTYKL
ncbi:TonB-dependent siderophore receptor [Ferruginibacter yonginensis]|uniref:TonB-dependent siderophore receptor n=1 Tax=Ferruginibacter yonginensis TaxID=1310416 RepID=A0ABV8QS17_9BACT